MYNRKLKYRILSIFAAAVMTLTAITPVWADEENAETTEASAEASSDSEKPAQKYPQNFKPAACGSGAHEWKPDRGGCIK